MRRSSSFLEVRMFLTELGYRLESEKMNFRYVGFFEQRLRGTEPRILFDLLSDKRE